VNLIDKGEFNGCRLYIGLRFDYRLRLWAPTSSSRAISAVAELLVTSAKEVVQSSMSVCLFVCLFEIF